MPAPEHRPQTRLPQYGLADLRARDSGSGGPANLADILERVLDKGIVIAGDIQVNLLDIELLTIHLRLLIASVDKAREMGINWWESDPRLTTTGTKRMEDQNRELRDRLERLERLLGSGGSEQVLDTVTETVTETGTEGDQTVTETTTFTETHEQGKDESRR